MNKGTLTDFLFKNQLGVLYIKIINTGLTQLAQAIAIL